MVVGNHSNLTRFAPKDAAKAAVSAKQQYRDQVKAIQKNQQRRKLPRTEQDFQNQVK